MRDRAFELQCGLIEEFRAAAPSDEAERVIWHQLLRALTSLSASSAESDGSHSRRDFIHKFQISLKEARESHQLLRLLHAARPDRSAALDAGLQRCDESIAILVASLKTAKRREAATPPARRTPPR